MSVYSTLAAYAAEWRAVRDEFRTRRALSNLPSDMLKDIGWPDAATERRFHRRGPWIGAR